MTMQFNKILSVLLPLVVASLLTAPAQAAVYKWVDQHGVTRYSDAPPPDAATEKIKGTISAAPTGSAAPASGDAATEAEEKENIRKELEQRDAGRAEQRRENCEKARTEIQRVGELPARRVQRIDENGERSRMTEDDQKAHLDKMRTIETENCL